MVFSSSASTGKGREVRPPEDAARDEILFAPLARRRGHCHGVVRLHNKRRPPLPVSSMFTDDDAAKLDAIIQTALPRLELLQVQERQLESLTRMIHELQSPLVAIRGAVNLMLTDLNLAKMRSEEVFRRDFPGDVLQWTRLMGRLIVNARIFGAGGLRADTLRKKRTSLLAEVVMPVIRQIEPLVPEKVRFDCHQENLNMIPPLMLDRDRIQQVFFNLLSNSIKYGRNKDRVRITIKGRPPWGMATQYSSKIGEAALMRKHKEEIFEPGFRSKQAMIMDVNGQGIGLFVVRSIIEAHGGSIEVRSCRNPTTFEVFFPGHLRIMTQKTLS